MFPHRPWRPQRPFGPYGRPPFPRYPHFRPYMWAPMQGQRLLFGPRPCPSMYHSTLTSPAVTGPAIHSNMQTGSHHVTASAVAESAASAPATVAVANAPAAPFPVTGPAIHSNMQTGSHHVTASAVAESAASAPATVAVADPPIAPVPVATVRGKEPVRSPTTTIAPATTAAFKPGKSTAIVMEGSASISPKKTRLRLKRQAVPDVKPSTSTGADPVNKRTKKIEENRKIFDALVRNKNAVQDRNKVKSSDEEDNSQSADDPLPKEKLHKAKAANSFLSSDDDDDLLSDIPKTSKGKAGRPIGAKSKRPTKAMFQLQVANLTKQNKALEKQVAALKKQICEHQKEEGSEVVVIEDEDDECIVGDEQPTAHESEETEICPICYDTLFDFEEKGRVLGGCGCSKFHFHCLKQWVQHGQVCPSDKCSKDLPLVKTVVSVL